MTDLATILPPPLGGWRHLPRAEVAYHEAAHVVLAVACGRRVAEATIIPASGLDGRVTVEAGRRAPDAPVVEPDSGVAVLVLVYEAAWMLSGGIGEALATGQAAGTGRDHEQAGAALARAADIIGVPALWWIAYVEGATELCLRRNWYHVETVARRLLDAGALDGADLQAMPGNMARLDLGPVTRHVAVLAGVSVA